MQYAIADPRTRESVSAACRFIEAHGFDPADVVYPARIDTEAGTVYGHTFDRDEHGQKVFHTPTAAHFKTAFEIPLVVDPADYGLTQWMEALD